ncbi:MAG: hypothetical protein HY557_00100 [Euryarchaeota archaeon]|nr:hypothetical protein [Euryarchaeota archaeon]
MPRGTEEGRVLMQGTRRPVGITILGILVLLAAFVAFLIALAGIFVGLAGLIPGSPIPAGTLLAGGLLYLLVSILLGIGGGGLMRMKVWAWWLATLTAVGYLVYSGFGTWAKASGGEPVGIGAALAIAISAIIVIYLLTVYRHFRPAAAKPM